MATPTQLVTKDDVKMFWPLSQNLDDARVNPWIMRAQESRLQILLGPALYYRLWNDAPAFADADLAKLFNGDVYKYDTNYDQRFPGVKELLCAYAYAFIVDNNQLHVTRGGVQRKVTPELSENVSPQTTSVKSQDAYSEAIRLEGEFFRYMSKQSAAFPEYNADKAPKNTSQMFWNASRSSRVTRYGLDEYYEKHPNG